MFQISMPAAASRFNPRTRDGCELDVEGVLASALVSIHAPVMGANAALKAVQPAPIAPFQSTHP